VSKQLSVEELLEKPDELIEAIKDGESFDLMLEGRQVATVNPVKQKRGGVPYPFRDFDFGSRPKGLTSDPAQVIIDERERERSGKKYGS
jgi:antitoxin (DNA-binding transcriptional repressor) of toxin-antitoxin stability system